MFRVLFFIAFICTISSTFGEKPEDEVPKDGTTALSAYVVSIQENVQNKLLNKTDLGAGQWCSNSTYCQDGQHCCSTTTCCANNRYCCGGGRYCCANSATAASSTVGLVVSALLLYFGTSWVKSTNWAWKGQFSQKKWRLRMFINLY